MSDTIREQIIARIISAAAAVLTTAGYNYSLGSNIFRAVKTFDASVALVVLPQPEGVDRTYGGKQKVMPVRLEGFKDIGSEDHHKVSEKILGDLIEFMTAPIFTMAYTSGSDEIEVGDTVTGHTSETTAYVVGVSLATGKWADGDAAGNLTLRRKSDDFAAENLDVGASLNVATTPGTVTTQNALNRVTNDLADDIDYAEGGQSEIPDGSAETAGAYAIFNIYYETKYGNPYGQP